MKSNILVFIAILSSLLFGCELQEQEKALPPSTGGAGEVVVVVDTFFSNRQTGHALDKALSQAQEGLPQREPLFRVAEVRPQDFSSVLQRVRNILEVDISSKHEPKIGVLEDIWSKGQLVISIKAANDAQAAEMINANRQKIRNYFQSREIKRLQRANLKQHQKEIEQKLKEKHELSLTVPYGYQIMEEGDDYFWLKLEKSVGEHQILQGMLVYYYPYVSDSTFSSNEVLTKKDAYTKEHIYGTAEGSYMKTFEEYPPVEQEASFNKIYAKEFRGLWNMEGDFMGGPFVHYVLVDEERQRVINLSGFVYAPKFRKREYLREVEALAKSLKL